MSSPAALQNASVFAKKGLSRRNRHVRYEEDYENHLVEREMDEYAFLDAKPASGRNWRGAKSRRRGVEALFQRKLANRAYLTKSVTSGGGDAAGGDSTGAKHLGKKRRARLLSDHIAEEFHECVPYSLNRKNRWHTMDAEGCVRRAADDLQQLANANSGGELKVKALVVERSITHGLFERDTDYQLNSGVTALHELNGGDEEAVSRQCKSARGVALRALQPADAQPADLSAHYIVSKAHTVPRFMSHYYIHGRSSKWWRRSNPSMKIYEDELCPHVDHQEREDAGGCEDSYGEYDWRQSGADRSSFTLADFVKDTSPPVIIRRTKSIMSLEDECERNAREGSALEDFVFADGDPVEKELATFLATHSSLKRNLDDARRKEKWLFTPPLTVKAARFGVASHATWLEQSSGLSGKWLGSHLLIDLSGQLARGGELTSPQLVLVIGYAQEQLTVVVNAAFKCHQLEDGRLERIVRQKDLSKYGDGLAGLLDLLTDVLRPHYVASLEEEPLCVQPSTRGAFSNKLSQVVKPTSLYDVILTAASGSPPLDFERLSPSPPSSPSLADGDEEFEYIEMGELGGSNESLNTAHELVEELCERCSSSASYLVSAASCPHKFCADCCRSELTHRLEHHHHPSLRCLNSKCCCELELDALWAVVPLPLANYIAAVAHVAARLREGHKAAECNGCRGLLSAGANGLDAPYGQLACAKCDQHLCVGCGLAPHWPMACEQSAQWTERFERQYELDCRRSTSSDSASPQSNTISQLFSRVCSQSRARRLDTQLSTQLAKNMRRLTSYRQERAFLEMRKCALQLLEFGFGWLYMQRRQPPKHWAATKALLATLNSKVEALESELLFSSSLTDAKQLLKKVEECGEVMEQAIEKFKQV